MSELSDLTLNFSLRDKTGTSASRQIRSQGRIPAVLYSKDANRILSVDDKEMRMLLRKAAGTSSLMRLIGEGGEDELVLIKELQEDKIHDKILHIDFVEVKRGEDLQTTVPLNLIGKRKELKLMVVYWRLLPMTLRFVADQVNFLQQLISILVVSGSVKIFR